MRSSYKNLSLAKEEYYAQCRMADFWIELKKAPNSEANRLSTLEGVTEIRTRIQFQATVDIASVPRPINAMVLSLPEQRHRILNDVVMKRGTYFTEHRENEVIINDAFARHHGVSPGQYVHLILNNRRQELFVVGTAISSEFVYMLGPGAILPDPEHFGVFYLKRRFAEDIFDFNGATNQVIGRLASMSSGREEEVLRRAESILEPFGVFTTLALKDQASNMYLSNEIEGLNAFGVVMPMIFLAVAAVVLNVLMNRLSEQQRVVIGTLKALGYGNRRLLLNFIKFGIAVGLIGGIVGVISGYILAGLMTQVYRGFFEFPALSNRFYWDNAAVGLGISIACAVLGTLQGARKVLRLQPAEAMRSKPPTGGGPILLERIQWLWRQFSFGSRMVLRNVMRNRLRTAAGLFAAAMGASLLVSGFMMANSMNYLIDFEFYRTAHSDFDMRFRDERSQDAVMEARRWPGVYYVEPLLEVPCTFAHGQHRRRGGITGLMPDARLTVPHDSSGRPLEILPGGVTMTQALADLLHVKRGDAILVELIKGQRDTHEVRVVNVADSYLGLSAYAPAEFLSRLINEESAVTGVQLLTRGDARQQADFYRELKRLPALQSITARDEMVASLTDTLLQNLWVILGLLILFAGVVFFGSILNSSLISLSERRTEIATLRVLGYTPWEIGALFFKESLVVNVVGTMLGLPIGYGITVAMAHWYNNELIRLPVVFPPSVILLTLGLAILFGSLAHAVVQRSILRMDWLDALNVKE
jgi:putative ABC transport system permease protein